MDNRQDHSADFARTHQYEDVTETLDGLQNQVVSARTAFENGDHKEGHAALDNADHSLASLKAKVARHKGAKLHLVIPKARPDVDTDDNSEATDDELRGEPSTTA